ncbi:MAG: helix-turn-helix transcriptional regulator [Planctomycetota bacterium]
MAGKDLIAASSRPLVLGILALGDSYGYAILQEVKRLSGGRLEWTDGMLYPVLHRLEREGLISSRWGVAPDTGRRRKYYRLVRKGKKVLAEDRAAWLGVHETLTKLWGTGPCPA